MITPGNYQPRVGPLWGESFECFDHQLQPFVGAPFSEGEDSVQRISAAREIGEFGTARENAVGSHMHIVTPVFIVQNLAVSRHQDGY